MIAALIAWCTAPMIMALTLQDVPFGVRLRAAMSMVRPCLTMIVMAPVVALSPLVVPIALAFTRREDNALPSWAWMWDNDVSINGDRAEYQDPRYDGWTYYCDAPPRSFRARFVWLVMRNRASRLAQVLGYTWGPGETSDAQVWGDPLVSRSHAGWQLVRRGPCWQFYAVVRMPFKLCLRINCGYKAWSTWDGRRQANVVYIPFSVLAWQGEA